MAQTGPTSDDNVFVLFRVSFWNYMLIEAARIVSTESQGAQELTHEQEK